MSAWPPLPYAEWRDTLDTLHRFTQVIGKIRLAYTPATNHSWHVALYVTPRGLTTSPIAIGARMIEFTFDFHLHSLLVQTSDGRDRVVPLTARSVADFYADVLRVLDDLGSPVRIHGRPNEVVDATPFADDHDHRSYDPAAVRRLATVLGSADRVFKEFRGEFIGKGSPSHFFWGSFDLAVTRFSGREAPPHPGGVPNLPDAIAREAYSHEVSSAGFWPGGEMLPEPVFYSYAYPEPAGFATAQVTPDSAYYHSTLKEFVLPYEAVRTASRPDDLLLEFLRSTYDAAATLGQWQRTTLERPLRGA